MVGRQQTTDSRCSHWQLRHYISHPENDVLYYASGVDIYYLNTSTKKRKHIHRLPFEARCTASGYGYICVGGEDAGHFAVIKLEGRSADVDAPLPLDYWQTHRSTPYAADARVERIGEEIVNSISIHRIQDEEAHLYDIVAVLTNNDKTVRIYSLIRGIEDCCLDCPFPMNHATISTDGTILVAVGDHNQAYVFTRAMRKDPPQIPKPHNRLNMTAVDWQLAGSATLYIPEPTANAGYFTTAWSPSGHLLALGSEAGYITIFDVRLFRELGSDDVEGAIVACIPSSRPHMHSSMHPGAVRSMVFSPEPWDLLIWAEDQGRICVGDLRTGLRTKQVVELEPQGEHLTKVELHDVREEDEDTFSSRRLLELEDEWFRRHRENFGDNFTESQLRQRVRRHYRSALQGAGGEAIGYEDDPQGLTAHEQEVLDSLRTARQREEVLASGNAARSVNYTSSGLFANHRHERAGMSNREATRSTTDLLSTSQEYDDFPELSRTTGPTIGNNLPETLPPLNAIQEYLMIRDRQSRVDRQDSPSPSSQDRWLPRRRASVVIGAPSGARGQRPIPPHAWRAEPSSTTTPSVDETGAWRTISDSINLARGPLFEAADAADRDHLRTLGQQRDRLRELQSRLEARMGSSDPTVEPPVSLTSRYELLRDATNGFQSGYDILRRRPGRNIAGLSTANGREIGVRTAGLAITRDGSTVWAATEEGIFEVKLDLKSRLRWPAVSLR